MADFPCQGNLSSNNLLANSVPGNAGSLSLFPEEPTLQAETLSEGGPQSVSPHKSKHKIESNGSFLERGSTTDLCNFSLRLVASNPKHEDTRGDTGIDYGELPKARQKQMVTEVSNLEEKKSLDIADAMFRDEISKVIPVRLFNFYLREISNEPQNLSSAIGQSEEPSANILSLSSLSDQHSCSPYRNEKLTTTGGVAESNNTECPFVPLANSIPVFRTQPIRTRKPPLPPGAMTYLKGGVSGKTNKVHVQSMTQDSIKHLGVSEIRTKNIIPTPGSNKEGCVDKGNSCPLDRRTASADTSRGSTVKSVMFDKVSGTATNSLTDLVTVSDNNQTAFPGYSRESRLSHLQNILPFNNDNTKRTLGNEWNVESDNKNASSSDYKRKCFDFEEEDKGIREFSIGESLCSNVGAVLQVTEGKVQNRSGLLPTSSDPMGHIRQPFRSVATSDDQMTRNIAKSSVQNFFHLKPSEADIYWHDREFSIPISSTTKKSRANLTQHVNYFSANSLNKSVEMQVQVSGTSSTASYSCKSIVDPYSNAQTKHCRQIGSTSMNSKKRDYNSCTTDYFKAPLIISQAERAMPLPLPSMAAIKQVHHNFHEGSEGYIHASKSYSTDVEVINIDMETVQRQFNQIKGGVSKLGSLSEGTVHGVDLEVIQSLHGGDPDNLKTENLPPEKSNSSHHNLQPLMIKNQMDTVVRAFPELCMDNAQKRWRKRLKWTHETDEKMLKSTCSEMVLDYQRQNIHILDQYGGLKGSRDSEADSLHHRVDFTRASKEVLKHDRSTACEKDAQKQHCGLPIQNEGDTTTSSLHKDPHCIEHQVSSSFTDDNTLNCTSAGKNTVDPTPHSTNSTELQKKVSVSGKDSSSRLQKKIDIATILSHPWIRRWRPLNPIASSLWKMHHNSLVNNEINPRSLPRLYAPMKMNAPMKMTPSARAMAMVGIAAQEFQSCQLQKKGSFSVWTAV